MAKLFSGMLLIGIMFAAFPAEAAYHFSDYVGKPPIHTYGRAGTSPAGMTPTEIKSIYHLPQSGGRGTIAIIGAYSDKTLESDLGVFDRAFGLPSCTTANGCLEMHPTATGINTNAGWAMETSLDVQWAHAIAPKAKILLVEAVTPSGANFIRAIDYAASRADVVAVSMSFGGPEFPEETSLDSHFVSKSGATFFASSGDNGAGTSWPASSPRVVAVGGTSIALNTNRSVKTETAWRGSGGGVSAYEPEPAYQKAYSIPKAGGMRAIPDVAYDADPKSGFPVVRAGVWHTVGGTSAGAPQWAAIAALGSAATNANFYRDKASTNHATYFTDILSGSNGLCTYYCDARARYDYVTGLGTPLTVRF
jgi:subtilase family serine protease